MEKFIDVLSANISKVLNRTNIKKYETNNLKIEIGFNSINCKIVINITNYSKDKTYFTGDVLEYYCSKDYDIIKDYIKSYFNESVFTFDKKKSIVKSVKLYNKTGKLINLSQYSVLNYGSKKLIRLFSKTVIDSGINAGSLSIKFKDINGEVV